MAVRVYLVDDHEIVRRGLSDLLEVEDDIEVVGESGSAHDALRDLARLRPDVAILDVRLPDDSGINLCKRLHPVLPNTSFLMLSSYSDPDMLARAVQAGAAGYLMKEIRSGQIVESVRRLARGEQLFNPAQKRQILERVHSKNSPAQRYSTLTHQERQVLSRVGVGMTNRQIAGDLSLAEKTVKNYLSSVMAKLGVERRTQAAVMYTRGDFGHPDDLD